MGFAPFFEYIDFDLGILSQKGEELTTRKKFNRIDAGFRIALRRRISHKNSRV